MNEIGYVYEMDFRFNTLNFQMDRWIGTSKVIWGNISTKVGTHPEIVLARNYSCELNGYLSLQ